MVKTKEEYERVAQEIAALVTAKQAAYGDAFSKAGAVLRVLYPNGVTPDKYDDMLTMVRVVDKLFRIATKNDPSGESPWRDILGYALLSVVREQPVPRAEAETKNPPASGFSREASMSRETLQGLTSLAARERFSGAQEFYSSDKD